MTHRPLVVLAAIFAIRVGWAAEPTSPPPPAGQEETRSPRDEAIGTAVAHELAEDARVRAMKIKVAVRDGVVTLTGTATDVKEKDAAETVVRRVQGVRDVRNQLAVEAPGDPAPGTSVIPEIPAGH